MTATEKDPMANSLLHNEVELEAPTDPAAALTYWGDVRVEALCQEPKDWAKYNLAGRRIEDLLAERRGKL